MRKAIFAVLFPVLMLLLSLPVAAQDNGTVIAGLVEQALVALDDDDLVTAQALAQGAAVLIDADLIAACDSFVQVQILLGQVAETTSTATAFALLTTAQTLIEGCGFTAGGGNGAQPTSPPMPTAMPTPTPNTGGFGGFGNNTAAARPPAEVLSAFGLDVDNDGVLIAEPDIYEIDLTDRDNTITRQRINEEWVGDFVMGGLITWGPGADEDECGVSFRYPDWDNTDNYYALTVEQQGIVYFRVRENGEFDTTSERYADGAVNLGAGRTNEIIVTGFGNTFTIYINGEQLAQFEDSTFTQGGIAVAMATFDESEATNCTFDDFWVWNFGAPITPDGGNSGILQDVQPHTPEELTFTFDYPTGWEDVAEFSGRAYIYNEPVLLAEVLILALSDDLRDNLADIDVEAGENLIVLSLLPLTNETSFTEVRVESILESFLPEIVPGFTTTPIITETLPPIEDTAKDPIARPLAYTDVNGLDMRIVLAGLDNTGNTALVFIFAEPDELDDTMPALRAILSSMDLQ